MHSIVTYLNLCKYTFHIQNIFDFFFLLVLNLLFFNKQINTQEICKQIFENKYSNNIVRELLSLVQCNTTLITCKDVHFLLFMFLCYFFTCFCKMIRFVIICNCIISVLGKRGYFSKTLNIFSHNYGGIICLFTVLYRQYCTRFKYFIAE